MKMVGGGSSMEGEVWDWHFVGGEGWKGTGFHARDYLSQLICQGGE